MALLFLFCLSIFQEEDPLQAAEASRLNGDFFVAEGQYLAMEPADEHIFIFGRGLSEIALRLGNLGPKYNFYGTLLTKSKNWRAVALLVRSVIAANRNDWQAFERNADSFLQEYGHLPDRFRLRLLYYLARYTAVKADDWKLESAEQQWFQASRALPPEQAYPVVDTAELPFPFRHVHLLETNHLFEPPTHEPATDENRYFGYLFQIKSALNREDLNGAAATINAITPLDKELASSELRNYYYPLLRDYFEKRERKESAQTVTRNLERVRSWALLPLVANPGRAREVADVVLPGPPAEKEAEAAVPETEPTDIQPAAKDVPEIVEPPKPDDRPESLPIIDKPSSKEKLTFEDMEKRLHSDYRGLELKIVSLDPNTTYKKVYKNYLLGFYYLKAGRMSSAFEHLHLAERLVHDYPFPILETKILLALGEVYETRSEDKNAEWKRIAAVQVWNAPENLPIFVLEKDTSVSSPYQTLLDTALDKLGMVQNINRLIYQHEMEHFTRLRRHAYERNVLYTNRVLGNQLSTVGTQINQMVRDLAERPRVDGMSQRYNEAVALWQQIWQKSLPYYRDLSVPSVKDIQKVLNIKDKVLVFLEGREKLGVLVITQNQALAVSLGPKARFMTMDDKSRFDFLEGRLGPVWNNDDPLLISLSPTLNDQSFVASLKARMVRPDKLKLIFSLKSLVSPKTVGDCRRIVVVGSSKDNRIADLLRSLPRAGLTWISDDKITRENITAALANHDQLIFIGPLVLDEKGLAYQCRSDPFFFHETIYHSGLCNLTLISDSFEEWIQALNELEIISPDASTSFYLLNQPNQYQKMSGKKYGLFFP